MALFEEYKEREASVLAFVNKYQLTSIENCNIICKQNGIDVAAAVRKIQPLAYDDACWAYTLGVAAILTAKCTEATQAARIIGEALQAFCLPGSVADARQVGVGQGNLAAMLLDEDVKCFAFLAGHESFAASEGAIGIARSVNKVRKEPLQVILLGLGKDAAEIIARINGFTYVRTAYDFDSRTLKVVNQEAFSKGERSKIRCYGANEMNEGVAIMELERVDASISGNATNMIRFQHPVAGAYKKRCNDKKQNYFACASGGGIGRTLNPDDTKAGPSSYGLTDMVSQMYADVIFAGSSSVPAHVEMMGFVGMGNNPMVGATVQLSVMAVQAVRQEAQ